MKNSITLQKTEINLDNCTYYWLDKDTFLLYTPQVKDTDEDGYACWLEAEWHEDEQKFVFTVVFEDEDGSMTDSINVTESNKYDKYINNEDKEVIKNYMKPLLTVKDHVLE